ncbi:hypothetical protein OIU34_18940 [Pararhizobium sp. BT-229]|uniref:hypothetical protein n=1 Tax=Pararhizobium sp. BT-229 TaxID=2986923 RepID=UPI0021F77C97|nr:hypothetical protein [Pararhizobium sp. BT-229]MCV9963958.1 hypothetical protein [Pararhizobium sp. BT-229]
MASITLRKALRFKKQIEAALRVSSTPSQIVIDIDDPTALADIAAFLAAEQAKVLEGVEKQVRLSRILSDVRSKIEAANANGVNAILAGIGHIDRQIALFKPIADAKPVQADLIQAKLGRKREASKTSQTQSHGYGHHRQDDGSTLQVSPLTQETISAFKAKLVVLRKEKEALEDRRLALNNRDDLSIEIGEDDLGFLAELEIV